MGDLRKYREKEVNVIETTASHANSLEGDEKEEEKIRQEERVEPREIQLEKADEEEASTQVEADGDKPSEVGVEETEESEREKIIELPCVHEGDDKIELLEQIRTDETLKPCRDLAIKSEWGYRWKNGLLLHKIVDLVHGEVERIVLPKKELWNWPMID